MSLAVWAAVFAISFALGVPVAFGMIASSVIYFLMAGIDLVHFGVVVVLNLMIGLITPPFGMLLFILSGLSKTPLSAIIKETLPFVAVLIVVLFLCTYVPDVVLFLPKMLGQ